MAAKKPAAKAVEAEATDKPKGQGRAVDLPNGQKRIDYIRDEYYNKGTSRSDIKKAINEMYVAANQEDKQIAYQIVFAATKTETDPRLEKKDEG